MPAEEEGAASWEPPLLLRARGDDACPAFDGESQDQSPCVALAAGQLAMNVVCPAFGRPRVRRRQTQHEV